MNPLPTQLVADVRSMLDAGGRILGIAGPPGAGKSTLAAAVAAAFPDRSVVAPMDGFHRLDEELADMGLLDLKGIAESFDGEAFVVALARVASGAPTGWPDYDRPGSRPVPDAITIGPDADLVIVEGNYLLVDSPPWNGVRPLLDRCWYVDVPMEVLHPRLVERHRAIGKDEAGARAKVESTDLPNARLVAATKSRADVVVTP